MNPLSVTVLVSFLVSTIVATDSEQIDFVTAFVGDFKSHKSQYIKYVETASNIPAEVTKLAVQANTYTNDDYTTLLSDVDVASLESYATNLPWYTRLSEEAYQKRAKTTTTVADSLSSSSEATTTVTSSAKSGVITSTSNSINWSSYDAASRSTRTGGAPAVAANVGGFIGAMAVALL